MAVIVGYDIKYTEACSCRACTSIIRHSKAEIQTKVIHNYTLEKIKQNYVICPKCGEHIELFTKQN